MQFKTKLGLVDIPNEDVLAASRDIMSSAVATDEIAGPLGSLCTGDLVGRLGDIASAAPFRDSDWNRTLQAAVMDMRRMRATLLAIENTTGDDRYKKMIRETLGLPVGDPV